ncbi:MAG: hypothetical protein K2R98_15545 [Gemmataceae bacterium]|nr:hypothetical protein [Gemmataceae bacterium]
MKSVPITNRSQELKRLLQMAKREDVVLQTPEGDEFILQLVDDFDYELARQRGNKKLMAFLDERLRQARKEPNIPLEEVEQQLGLNSHGKKVTRRKAGPHPR